MFKADVLKKYKAQLLCMTASVFLAGLSLLTGNNDQLSEGIIRRNGYGEADRSCQIGVEGISESVEYIDITVLHRSYSKEEAEQKIAELMDSIPLYICGNNESLDAVRTDLKLPRSIPGFEGIQLSWYSENTDLLSSDGRVFNEELTEPADAALRLSAKADACRQEYRLPLKVLPAALNEKEQRIFKLIKTIRSADENQRQTDILTLPSELDGKQLKYSGKKSSTPLLILLLGAAAALLLGLKPKQDLKKAKKEQELQLVLDYSEVISRLLVYTGAGLTIRNAWRKTALDHQKTDADQDARHLVYEEMYKAYTDMEKGIPENQAYMDFARRCGPRCYTRLASLLSLQYKNGGSTLSAALELEMEEAFEQRKNTAKRLGEEASTKLMAPLMLSLITVFMIVVTPAVMAMG